MKKCAKYGSPEVIIRKGKLRLESEVIKSNERKKNNETKIKLRVEES